MRPRKSCFSSSPKAGKGYCPSSKVVKQEKCSLTRESVSFSLLFRPSTAWARPTRLGRAICLTQPTDSNVSLIQRPPHGQAQGSDWPGAWAACVPVKLTRKSSHRVPPVKTPCLSQGAGAAAVPRRPRNPGESKSDAGLALLRACRGQEASPAGAGSGSSHVGVVPPRRA